MKQILRAAACLLLTAMLLAGCGIVPAASSAAVYTFTDDLGNAVTLHSTRRVVSLYGSFAETWQLAGGSLVGVTEDAISERGMTFAEEVAVVGSVKEPNFEEILAAQPDLVLLSADIAGHAALQQALAAAQIPHAYFRVDTAEDYLRMLRLFCDLTGRPELYEQNGTAVQRQIEAVRARAAQTEVQPTVLLLRAFSTGCKAKGADNLAGAMLADLGCDNLADRYDSLLEDVNVEAVIAADPDYIFITIMGADEQNALNWVAQNLQANPAWAGLAAVQNGRCHVLPKELFHYKPNARWGESYEYLADLLFGPT